jgi:hypothetical protein
MPIKTHVFASTIRPLPGSLQSCNPYTRIFCNENRFMATAQIPHNSFRSELLSCSFGRFCPNGPSFPFPIRKTIDFPMKTPVSAGKWASFPVSPPIHKKCVMGMAQPRTVCATRSAVSDLYQLCSCISHGSRFEILGLWGFCGLKLRGFFIAKNEGGAADQIHGGSATCDPHGFAVSG